MEASQHLQSQNSDLKKQSILEVTAVIALLAAGNVLSLMTQSQIVGAVFLLATVGFIWLMLRHRQSGWSEFGLTWPQNWLKTISWPFFVSLGFAAAMLLIMYLIFNLGAIPPPDISRFEMLRGNLPLLIGFVAAIWITAALFEELIFRGFLMNRLAEIFGGTASAWRMALIIHAVIFGLIHVYQGPTGVVMTGLTGLIFGALYLYRKRNLWNMIFLHGFINTNSMLMIYFGVDQLFV